MKKVMKFVKGKREDDTLNKFTFYDSKRLSAEKIESHNKDDEFVYRDKSVTKLHKAVWNENCDKLKSIIKTHDIDITDKFDRTALYFAVLKNNSNIVAILLDNNANQSIPDIDGITPFLKSVQLGYLQCAQILLDHGADIKRVDKDSNSCVHVAVTEKHIHLLTFLLNRHADVNVTNSNGEYPLHIATKIKNLQMIELLLNHNSDMNATNSEGVSPIALAKQKDDLELTSIFQKHISKIQKQNNMPSSSNTSHLNSELNKPNNSDSDGWNDSPVTSPSRKQNDKYLAKIAEHLYCEDVSVCEEKSESDISIKCSENTSPQSGIIPPPCKPLRSLEYLQSGLTLDSRPVHLLTLGTVRTRHISMTESDHSKNNTPHRYSYQGDFQVMGAGDSFTKLPDDKGDSVNVSVKSKLLSKLECDSTIQSDWGSNESLPLDESSCCGKKDPKPLINNGHKTNSSCGSIRDKSIDTFLQKQFSILEDYEKNHERNCSVSHEICNNGNNSDSHLDDIDHLLEDNNRINAQLEKYAGQSDILLITKKSKSLPRNCESYNSYHKGSFSLPRTLEAGKDPFREMRSCGYFKPKSHFFSLKLYKSDRRSGFMDKLKNMFNKKSQIHLSESAETSGTWLHKDQPQINNDNESRPDYCKSTFKAEHSFSLSENNDLQNRERLSEDTSGKGVRNEFNNMRDLEMDNSSMNISFAKHNISKAMERKIITLSNMHFESAHSKISSSSNSGRSNVDGTGNVETVMKPQKNIESLPNLIACEDCSEYLNFKLLEAEKIIVSKEKFINLLKGQLNKLQERNMQTINQSHKNYYKYGLAMHELIDIKHVCGKNDEEFVRLHTKLNREATEEERATLKEEDENWRKQLNELIEQDPSFHENNWHRVLQNEVVSAVSAIRENSESVINALEAQNAKLETIVVNLKSDLEQSSLQRRELEHNLTVVTNELQETKSFKNNYETNFEATIKKLLDNKENLENELKNTEKKYASLQQEYEKNIKQNDSAVKHFNKINSEYEILKEKHSDLSHKLSKFTDKIENMKQHAKSHNKVLKKELKKINCDNLELDKHTTASDDSLEIVAIGRDSTDIKCKVEEVCAKDNTVDDFVLLDAENLNLENTLFALGNQQSEYLENENRKLKEEIDTKSKLVADLKNSVRGLEKQLRDNTETLKENGVLKSEIDKISEKVKQLQSELKAKDVIINEQMLRVTELGHRKQELEILYNKLQAQIKDLKNNVEKQKNVNSKLEVETRKIKDSVDNSSNKNINLIKENEKLKIEIAKIKEEKISVDKELQTAVAAMEELQSTISGTYEKIKHLEALNKDLKEQVASVLNKYETLHAEAVKKDKEMEQYKRKLNTLSADILSLNERYNQEKVKSESMATQLDSLKFYHENEMSAKNARYKELKKENDSIKLELQSTLQNVKDKNSELQNKITELVRDRANLCDKIQILTNEVNKLKSMSELNTVKIQDDPVTTKLVEKNAEFKSASSVRKQVFDENNKSIADENKLLLKSMKCSALPKNNTKTTDNNYDFNVDVSEERQNTSLKHESLEKQYRSSKIPVPISKKNSLKMKINTDSSNNGEKHTGAPKVIEPLCKKLENEYAVLLERLNNIEEQLNSILVHKIKSKSQSMTNLDNLADNKINNHNDISKQGNVDAPQKEHHFIRKSSSIHCVPTENIKENDVSSLPQPDCFTFAKMANNVETLQHLETQLVEIINMLVSREENKASTSTAIANTDIDFDKLQRQIRELQIKLNDECSKSNQLETEFRRLKGETVAKQEMEKEISNLRKQLNKETSDRAEEMEYEKKEKEVQRKSMQEEFKYEFLICKQKLLSDISKVQSFLLAKNEDDTRKHKKYAQFLKEVEANQEVRKKQIPNYRTRSPPPTKSKPVELKGTVRPLKNIVAAAKTRTEKVCPCAGSLPSTSKACHCVVRIATDNTNATFCVCDAPQPVLLNVARQELNATVQRHRPNTDAATPVFVLDEDLNKKYLIQ